MAIASTALSALSSYSYIDYGTYLQTQPPILYQPLGILGLLGQSVPPASFFETVRTTALISTWFAFFGLFSRISMLFSAISSMLLSGLEYSFLPYWCHGWNVIHIVQIAFLFARSGDRLSLDALIRRWVSRLSNQESIHPSGYPYRWPVLLAQWAVALMFANAAWYKLMADGFHIGWALSDNLRHQLVIQYYGLGREPPPLVEWVMTNDWRYKGAALGNLFCQIMPLLACVFSRRPLLRACFGAFFVFEVIGLGLMMEIWDLHWLRLYALFVDWDRLLAWLTTHLPWCRGRLLPSRLSTADTEHEVGDDGRGATDGREWYRFGAGVFISCFLVYDVLTGIRCPGCENRTTYPFSSYPMYSNIAAKRPLSEHQSYEFPWVRFEWRPEQAMPEGIVIDINSTYNHLTDLDDNLATERLTLQSLKSSLHVDSITMKTVIYQVRAYPAHPKPISIHEGLMSSLDEKGRFRAVALLHQRDPQTQQHYFEVKSEGYENPQFRFSYILNRNEGPIPLDVIQKGNRYYWSPREVAPYRDRFLISVTDPSLGHEEHVYMRIDASPR